MTDLFSLGADLPVDLQLNRTVEINSLGTS
jgi:hypothetical protein